MHPGFGLGSEKRGPVADLSRPIGYAIYTFTDSREQQVISAGPINLHSGRGNLSYMISRPARHCFDGLPMPEAGGNFFASAFAEGHGPAGAAPRVVAYSSQMR